MVESQLVLLLLQKFYVKNENRNENLKFKLKEKEKEKPWFPLGIVFFWGQFL
jgi:hypothetical protein